MFSSSVCYFMPARVRFGLVFVVCADAGLSDAVFSSLRIPVDYFIKLLLKAVAILVGRPPIHSTSCPFALETAVAHIRMWTM